MKRAAIMAIARTQETDARCMTAKYGHHGKRQGAKKVRQYLQRQDRKEHDARS